MLKSFLFLNSRNLAFKFFCLSQNQSVIDKESIEGKLPGICLYFIMFKTIHKNDYLGYQKLILLILNIQLMT